MAMLLNKRETPGSRVQDGIRRGLLALGLPNYTANKWAHKVTSPLLALTPLGAAEDAVNKSREYAGMMQRGQQVPLMGGAPVAMAALGAVPGGRAAREGGELAMDTASRMARATEQGFTIPVFHGTRASEPFDRFTTYGGPQAHDLHGVHVGSVDAANERLAKYFKGVDLAKSNERPSVMPLMMRMEKPYLGKAGKGPLTEAELRALVRKNAKANGISERQAKVEIRNELLRRGYDVIPYVNSVEDKGAVSYLVLKPENLRSRFAAFDPAKRNSANIMAGIGGVGILGAGMMPAEQQQPQGQRIY